MRLTGERVVLRHPEPADADSYLRWFNDPEVVRFLRRSRPMGRVEEEEFLRGLAQRKDDVIWLIEAREGGLPIGSCGLHGSGGPDRKAELGIAIGEREYWSRGYGREVVGLLLAYGFDVLNLHRIGLSVFEYNERGRRCYERAGFRLEGRRREAKFMDGRYWDELEMGVLACEWRADKVASREEFPVLASA